MFKTLHLLCYLQMGPMSYGITLHKAVKACTGHTLKLIVPNHKLQRKGSVVNTVQELYSKCFQLLCSLQMGPMNYSITSHKAIKACKGQTFKLIGPNHMLQRKWSVVNTASGPYSKHFFFFVTYEWILSLHFTKL
jgi:hypothetical protein